MLVADATVLAAALADDADDGGRARTRLRREALAALLLTADARLAKAPGPRCAIEVLR